jgi:hypothetical protein
MFRHVVLFRWSAAVDDEARAEVSDALGELGATIDTVRAYTYGPDAAINDGNFDFAVIADFDDADGYLAYRDHPAHRRVVTEILGPIVAERAAVQLGIPPD